MIHLISEAADFNNVSLLVEEKNGKKEMFIEGIFLQAEKKNRNGRIYPKEILEREVNKFKDNHVNARTALGELNHPPSPSINPERASHLITELKLEGTDYIGKAKVLSTPIGQIVRGLIEDGVQLGVSSRGLGSLKEGVGQYKGSKLVQPDYRLVTVDVVSDPSAHDAWVNGVFESVSYIIENGTIKEYKYKKEAKQVFEKAYTSISEKQINEAEKLARTKAMIDQICKLMTIK
jgi:hypothetical protein